MYSFCLDGIPMRLRHKICWRLVRPLVAVFLRIKFGYRWKKAKNLPETYIVLSNHNTDYDPLLVGVSFPRQMYFVASEHIARWKIAYRFLRYFLAPIMRYKGTSAFATIREILLHTREGANVAMFAEGARSWDGVTAPILPSTGKMIKKASCALVTYRIEGGYFVSPNWSESNTRRGRLYGAPVNVYTKEQLAAMTADEVNEAIARDLHEDAYERQRSSPVPYKGKGLAEHMENLLFLCHDCGEVDSIRSQDDTVKCTKCGLTFRYNQYGMLEGAPFQTVRELAAWQRKEVAKAADADVIYTVPSAALIQIENHIETPICEGKLSMSKDALVCGETSFPLSQVKDMAMHGRHALVFSTAEGYYELLIPKGSNALKFQLLFDVYRRSAETKSEAKGCAATK